MLIGTGHTCPVLKRTRYKGIVCSLNPASLFNWQVGRCWVGNQHKSTASLVACSLAALHFKHGACRVV